jgi:hypothetical protein
MGRLLAAAALLVFLGVAHGATSTADRPKVDPDFRKFLEGQWDEGGGSEQFCAPDRNLRRIVVSPDGQRVTWELSQPVDWLDGSKVKSYAYRVLQVTDVSLKLALEGETRKNPRGDPFVWELVVVGPDRMRWRSTHFSFGVYNNVWLVRCK